MRTQKRAAGEPDYQGLNLERLKRLVFQQEVKDFSDSATNMEIKTLESVPVAEIADTFNLAFSDYLIPISLTENDLRTKMASENTIPEYSAGVFSEERLVGFILMGIDNNVAYNGGTGVIPEFRGQNLTKKMYDFLLPKLAQKGIASHLLEVITENVKAIPVYQKIGFEIARTVSCFKGKVTTPKQGIAEIRPIDFPEENEVGDFRDFTPTYQNTSKAIMRTADAHRFFWCICQWQNGRLYHFGGIQCAGKTICCRP
jgi:ribosomal protein S18 acetylase RimI-like enzyme